MMEGGEPEGGGALKGVLVGVVKVAVGVEEEHALWAKQM
jgi:hypothetical protein